MVKLKHGQSIGGSLIFVRSSSGLQKMLILVYHPRYVLFILAYHVLLYFFCFVVLHCIFLGYYIYYTCICYNRCLAFHISEIWVATSFTYNGPGPHISSI